MGVVRGRRVTDGASAAREHVTQEESQLLQVVLVDLIVIPKFVILCWSACPLQDENF